MENASKKCAELEEQVERLRWHYPDKGELPPKDVKFVAEALIHDSYFMMLLEWSHMFDAWRGDDSMAFETNQIRRWKYLD